MDLGSGRRGVDMGPSAIRIAGLDNRLVELGHKVIDEGDIVIKNMEELKVGHERARYLTEISRAAGILARKVERITRLGHFPLVLGGDHSIAVGTVSGIAAFAHPLGKKVGLIWIDAHGDINTPETSPSGNIHGMPLAALLGFGASELTGVAGPAPKIDPAHVALVGIRSLDTGEKKRLKETGVHVHTMADIDRHGADRVMQRALAQVTSGTDYVHVSLDLDAVDPVLKGDDPCAWADDGNDRAGRGSGVVEFHGEDDDVDLGKVGWNIGRQHIRKVDVAKRADQLQTALFDCRKMGAPGDEGDIVPGFGEPRAEVAPDAARSHDGDTHDLARLTGSAINA